MLRSLFAATTFVAFTACHTYAPAPVDLDAWRAVFAARSDLVRDASADATLPFRGDLADGIDLGEARQLAAWLHPECRSARAAAGVAKVAFEQSGRLPDPELGVDVERIVESVAHPWIVAGELGLTIPLSGRLGASEALARERHGEALALALAVEVDVRRRCELAVVRLAAARERATLLHELVQQVTALETIGRRLEAANEVTAAAARTFTLERVQREGELLLADAALAAAELECRRETGLPPDAAVTFTPTFDVDPAPATPEARREQLPASVRVLFLRARHEVAERSLALAVSEQWPDLVLRPGGGEEDAQPRASLGFTIPLPLWNGNAPAIHEARARRDEAAEALRGGYETALQDLGTAELRLATAERHLAFAAVRLAPLAAQQVADCRRLAELGQLEPLLILDAVVRDHGARDLVIAARLARAEAAIAANAMFARTESAAHRTEPR